MFVDILACNFNAIFLKFAVGVLAAFLISENDAPTCKNGDFVKTAATMYVQGFSDGSPKLCLS